MPTDTESKLLIGRETDLDTGGRSPWYNRSPNYFGNLNLADATFNGVALGGDATDGVAYFAAERANDGNRYSYIGILSGTNLGAPLTDTEGSAKWIGSFRHEHNPALIDFVLNVSFGTGDGAGEIEALVERYVRYYDYHLTGEFDDAGVITGTARRGEFRTNDPTNRGTTVGTGKLTGLIGEEGAVGAFIIDNYFGGFVARPSSAEELRTLEQTCADDPSHKLCSLGYESERIAIFCTNHPFDAQCRGDNSYRLIRRTACTDDPFATRCAGDAYNDLRVSFCEGKVGTHPSCPTPQVTAEVWADSFDEDLASRGSIQDTESKFLKGGETGLDMGNARVHTRDYSVNLNLANATFNGVALGGDAADGFSYAPTRNYDIPLYMLSNIVYSGILSGTNLGAPLTQTQGTAKWIGQFEYASDGGKDFVLNVSFGTGDGAGELKALVQDYYKSFNVTGSFDEAGVITGAVELELLLNPSFYVYAGDPQKDTSVLTGLIGEEGAVGIFIVNGDGIYSSSHQTPGGFVARPASQAELAKLMETCADNPFNKHCNLGYESERNAIIEHCVVGDNANDSSRCHDDGLVYDCFKNPFNRYCFGKLTEAYYRKAQNSRVAFCRRAGNVDNALCTVEDTYNHICRTHPFDAQCISNDRFTEDRRDACRGNPFATRCAGDVYNYLRVDFCRRNADNSDCLRLPTPVVPSTSTPVVSTPTPVVPSTPVVSTPTTDRVTAADWVDSFDTAPPTSLASTDHNQFLQVTESMLNGLRADKILTLADDVFGDKGGDASDGIAFFNTYEKFRYVNDGVGILPSTDLGEPLAVLPADAEGNPVTAIWEGKFKVISHSSSVTSNMNLNLDLTNRTLNFSHSECPSLLNYV